jgi:hypothetical protein
MRFLWAYLVFSLALLASAPVQADGAFDSIKKFCGKLVGKLTLQSLKPLSRRPQTKVVSPAEAELQIQLKHLKEFFAAIESYAILPEAGMTSEAHLVNRFRDFLHQGNLRRIKELSEEVGDSRVWDEAVEHLSALASSLRRRTFKTPEGLIVDFERSVRRVLEDYEIFDPRFNGDTLFGRPWVRPSRSVMSLQSYLSLKLGYAKERKAVTPDQGPQSEIYQDPDVLVADLRQIYLFPETPVLEAHPEDVREILRSHWNNLTNTNEAVSLLGRLKKHPAHYEDLLQWMEGFYSHQARSDAEAVLLRFSRILEEPRLHPDQIWK